MPAPDESPPRPRRQFEILRHPQTFNPENFTARGFGHNQTVPPRAWNFRVREQILKFCRRLETNRPETVACVPMTQCDFISNLVRVEKFTRLLPAR